MAQGRIACLLGPGFEDSEFRVPYDELKNAGYQVDIVGPKAGLELKGYKGKETVKADKGIGEVRPEDYQALVIPGGHSPDQLRRDKRFVEFVKKFDALKRPLAAVCHGPQLLLTARLVKGRTLTAWETVQGDLEQAGANVKDQEVVIDQNWITSRKPEDLKAFSEALLSALRKAEKSPGANAQPRA
jgi:protease I